ncbi:MAG: ROK family protein [Fibrobacterota bacterium]
MVKKNACYAGVDIGATKILSTVYDKNFRVLGKARKKTKAHEGTRSVVERIYKAVDEALEEGGVSRRSLKGLGVGCPGPVDPAKGIVREAPNLGWKNFPLKRVLQGRYGSSVAIVNDVDAGLYGECRFGAGKNSNCVVGIFPGTGIGGACVRDGRLWTGAHSSCFEIGHVMVQPGGPRCGCGARGCLEAMASRLAISSAAVAAAYRGEAPHLLASAGLDIANYGSGVLAEAITKGDKAIERLVRDAADWLGVGVAMTVNLLLPDLVVLGGGLVEAMPKLYLEETGRSARARVLPSYRNTFKLSVAKLGDFAAVLGAAAWARHLFNPNDKF